MFKKFFILSSCLLGVNLFAQGIPNYPCYRTVEETFNTAKTLTEKYPDLAKWIDVGDSWQKVNNGSGYDMMVLILTNKKTNGNKPKLFTTSAIHAREFATAELMTRFAENLLENYGKDADATWMLDHHEMHLMLHTNPDGRKKAEPNIMWRKNVNTTICKQGGKTGPGVDLNRNFSFEWGKVGSNNECGQDYRGKSAGSEPETQAVQNYMKKLFKDVRGPNKSDKAPDDTPGTYIDVHSYGEIIYLPKGMGNSKQLTTLANKYAFLNQYAPQFGFDSDHLDKGNIKKPRRSYSLKEDHSFNYTYGHGYGELGVSSFLFELGTNFFQKCSYFTSSILPKNFKALKYALRVVRAPYLLPSGPDVVDLKISKDGKLTATLDDTRSFKDKEPVQLIQSAEFFVDTPPWVEGATPVKLEPVDGKSDSSKEAFSGSVDVSKLSKGKHIIYVRGKDASGSIGPVSAEFLTTDN